MFRKIEQDNCFTIQQLVNETHFAHRKTVIMQRFTRFRTNFRNLRISQVIIQQMRALPIYGQNVNDICHPYIRDILLSIRRYSARFRRIIVKYLLCTDDR